MATSAAMPAPASPARPAPGAHDRLLTSKITVPGVPGWLVPRPRVDKLIAQGAEGPITTVTGPPGAGKTMALALWAAGRAARSPRGARMRGAVRSPAGPRAEGSQPRGSRSREMPQQGPKVLGD